MVSEGFTSSYFDKYETMELSYAKIEAEQVLGCGTAT